MKLELAYFGHKPVFSTPKSTSNLIQPDKQKYLEYLNISFGKEPLATNNSLLLQKFQERFSTLHGVKHCIPVINGLWGLVMTIDALRIEGRNEIIMPSLTYRRMADIAAWLNLVPRFCDVDKNNFGVTRETIEKCITPNTAIVLAPHPIVNLCDINGITNLCQEHTLPLLFDSVESYYADYNGKSIGGFGDAECFSLHASKFFNGFEGGYITTNNDELAHILHKKITGGEIDGTQVKTFGLNLQLIDYHAAMALACLDNLDKQIKHNKEIFYTYKKNIADIPGLKLIEYNEQEKRSFKNILIELTDEWPLTRALTIDILHLENMIVRPYYSPALHEMERGYETITQDIPNTNYWKERLLLMPCGEFVSTEDVELIMDTLKKIQMHSKIILKQNEQ